MYHHGITYVLFFMLGLSGVACGQGLGGSPLDFYVGGSVGASVVNLDYDNGVEINGLGAIGGKVFGGLIVNKYIGIEGQYVRFGEAEIKSAGGSSDTDLTGWGFAATGNAPITERLTLVARAGFLDWESDEDDGTDLHVGGGFRFEAFDNFALRADWDFYPLNADGVDLNTHMVTIGGQFNF
ncbi:MAG: outer membrane beta-barrel protein [Gammaproteobacteria bacterium]|nr:outer membrane beta-barrel protein [Gammaproteobacteria bacterium]